MTIKIEGRLSWAAQVIMKRWRHCVLHGQWNISLAKPINPVGIVPLKHECSISKGAL